MDVDGNKDILDISEDHDISCFKTDKPCSVGSKLLVAQSLG